MVMLSPSEQLGRRSTVVHFAPYDGRDAADRDKFWAVLGQLVKALPLSDPKQTWEALSPHLQDIFVGSLGCVGS